MSISRAKGLNTQTFWKLAMILSAGKIQEIGKNPNEPTEARRQMLAIHRTQ